MINNKRLCIECAVPMIKTHVTYNGIQFEARECPKCHEKIFTEDLTMQAISKLEAKRLKEEYTKRPIKIGHSIGITFPKEITTVFGLAKTKILKIYPNVAKRKIEITF